MYDVSGAGALARDIEARRPGAFGECAVRRTDDKLRVPAVPQPARQGQERLLPAAPGEFGVNVGDGKRGQNPNVSFR